MEMTAQVVTFHSIFSRERLIEASFVVLLYSQQPGFALVFGVHFVTKIMTIIQAHLTKCFKSSHNCLLAFTQMVLRMQLTFT